MLDLETSKLTLDYQAWPNFMENDESNESFQQNFEPKIEISEPKGNFKCAKCDYSTNSKRHLSLHKRSHRSCEKCGHEFFGKYSKREHILHMTKCMMPKKEKPIHACPGCERIFDFPSLLTRHMKSRNHFPK